MDNEKVSIIMGAYNSEKTIARSIESILSQTYQNWELIICDDASTDSTLEIALNYQKENAERITVLKNESNLGLAATLNVCLKYCRGVYIARMDADDVSLPNRLEKQIAFMKNNSKYDLCGTWLQYIDEDSNLGAVIKKNPHPDKYSLHRQIPFAHATILARKEAFDRLNGYADLPRTVRCEDIDLWYRFYKEGFQGANIEEVLYLVYETEESAKKRTIRNRWNLFKTEVYGYRLLGYSVVGYWRPVLNLMKCLIPPKVLYYLRKSAEKFVTVDEYKEYNEKQS